MSLLRRRAKSRSCNVHGDNGCEIQGEAGPRERAQDKRSIDELLDPMGEYRDWLVNGVGRCTACGMVYQCCRTCRPRWEASVAERSKVNRMTQEYR